jgi:uncharacterized protein YndB with AHSA1/START domain
MTAEEQRVERTLVLPSPPEEVWAALTQPDRLGAWFDEDTVVAELELRPGGRARFVTEGVERRALIEAVDPARRLSFRWLPDPRQHPALSMPRTRVTFELEPVDEGTRLTVVEEPMFAIPREALA